MDQQKVQPKMCLSNIGGGAAEEKFNHELQNVLNNILDINTDLKAREIKLVVKFKPDCDRAFMSVEVACNSKLSPPVSFETKAFLGIENGKAKALEHNPQELNLFQDDVTQHGGLTAHQGGRE